MAKSLDELEHEFEQLKRWRDSFCLQLSQDMKGLREAAQQDIKELEKRVKELETPATEVKRKFGIK